MENGLDLIEVIKYSYKKKNILIYIVLIALALSIIYSFFIKKPIYKVTAKILIDKSDASIEQFVTSKDLIQNEIQSKFDKTSKIITINTKTKNQNEILNMTNEYIEKLQIKLKDVYDVKKFTVIEQPEFPQEAININHEKDILSAIILGIVVYGVYIIFLVTFRGKINTIEIRKKFNIKVLGSIDVDKKKIQKADLNMIENEKNICQLKRIQANLILNKENKELKTILLTGIEKKVCNSYITNNLALQFAKSYSKILIIDADLNNKTLTKFMNQNESNGLIDVFKSNNDYNVRQLIKNTKIKNVFILPAGNAIVNEERLLAEKIHDILEELKEDYDIILIDSSSINENVLPIYLTNISDATIMVAQSEKTKQEDVLKTKMEIESVGGKIAGIIFNKTI